MVWVFACSRSGAENVKEVSKLMEKVLGLRQKIAGMSIPLEKFVARKAPKFKPQGRLALPVLELAYLFSHTPRVWLWLARCSLVEF